MSHNPTEYTERVQDAREDMDAAWARYSAADTELATAKRDGTPQPELDLLQDGLQDYYQDWSDARAHFNNVLNGGTQ